MAVSIGNQNGKKLTDIIRSAMVNDKGEVNTDAVAAAEYFISLYTQWSEISTSFSPAQSITFDQMVLKILHGEAHLIATDIQSLIDHIPHKEKMKEVLLLMTSLLSGEVLVNPFVMQYRERINAAVILDALNEVAQRQLSGKAREAANIQRWQVLSILVGLAGNSGGAAAFHLNLREALSHGS